MNNLVQRILTGSALALVTLWLIFNSAQGFAVVVAVAAAIVGYEFAKLNQLSPVPTFIIVLVVFLPIGYLVELVVTTNIILTLLCGLLFWGFWLKNLLLVMSYPGKKSNNTALNKIINLVLLLSPLTFLVTISQHHTQSLLLLLLIVWGADSFAYFSGKAFGKHKLAPNLSGGKTIEGVIGGLIGVVLITGVWMCVTDNLDWWYLPLALITGIFSVVGDLYQSIYKREAGVKDSGNILPGHGGLFDRLDGLLAATPIFVIGLMLLS